MAAAGILSHSVYQNREYTNIFMILPLLWMLVAAVPYSVAMPVWKGRMPGKVVCQNWPWRWSAWWRHFLEGQSSSRGALYRHWDSLGYPRLGFLYSFESTQITKRLSEIPPSRMRGVMWDAGPLHATGGYYYLHHRVPLLFPEGTAEHKKMLKARKAARETLVSHIVGDFNQRYEGFRPEAFYKKHVIYVNEDLSRVRPLNPFSTQFDGPYIFINGTPV